MTGSRHDQRCSNFTKLMSVRRSNDGKTFWLQPINDLKNAFCNRQMTLYPQVHSYGATSGYFMQRTSRNRKSVIRRSTTSETKKGEEVVRSLSCIPESSESAAKTELAHANLSPTIYLSPRPSLHFSSASARQQRSSAEASPAIRCSCLLSCIRIRPPESWATKRGCCYPLAEDSGYLVEKWYFNEKVNSGEIDWNPSVMIEDCSHRHLAELFHLPASRLLQSWAFFLGIGRYGLPASVERIETRIPGFGRGLPLACKTMRSFCWWMHEEPYSRGGEQEGYVQKRVWFHSLLFVNSATREA